MANYARTHIGNEGRVELHEVLGLTGAEVSVNNLPAGAGVPFVHAHKENEEIYGVLEGAGSATIDGEDIELAAGDWLRISPAAHRQLRAASDSGSHTFASRSSRAPLVPSRLTTLSCANSRRQCARRSTRAHLSTSLRKSFGAIPQDCPEVAKRKAPDPFMQFRGSETLDICYSHSIVRNYLQFVPVCRSLPQFVPFTSSLKNCRESMVSNLGHGFRVIQGVFVGHGGSRLY